MKFDTVTYYNMKRALDESSEQNPATHLSRNAPQNSSKIAGLIFSILTVIFLCCALNAKAAKADTTSGKKVLDLGELEVEGEVRRPPVDWIDSNKRMKQQIPGLYASQFRKLEEELLCPITKSKAQSVLSAKSAEVKTRVNN